MKRSFDLLSSIIALLLLSPVLLFVALLIKITMPGPVLFRQTRIGLGGKPFTIYKFRSMKVNRDDFHITLNTDSRITPFGQFMRKTKLDELPQLWNIIVGDMSVVGPRPDVPGYADKLQGDDRLILTVRPGLTGAGSVKYNNEEDLLAMQDDPVYYNDHILYPDKVRIDLGYIKHWSFWLDLKIILFTLLGRKLKEGWAN